MYEAGPSAALFEYLAATIPDLTVKEVNHILKRERVHKGVILALEAFDVYW